MQCCVHHVLLHDTSEGSLFTLTVCYYHGSPYMAYGIYMVWLLEYSCYAMLRIIFFTAQNVWRSFLCHGSANMANGSLLKCVSPVILSNIKVTFLAHIFWFYLFNGKIVVFRYNLHIKFYKFFLIYGDTKFFDDFPSPPTYNTILWFLC